MAKTRCRTFTIAEGYHLYKVDKWWAGLLRHGAKEIILTEWEALGNLSWKLRIHWRPVSDDVKLNVGHPEYADCTAEDLEHLTHEALSNFESAYADFTILEGKVQSWELAPKPLHGKDGYELVYKDTLDDAEKIIAVEYLWPQYRNLKRLCSYLAIQLRELEAEAKARGASDYFAVKVDRGMLRVSYVDQIGYDNDFLFEEVEFFPPDALD